MNKLMIFMIELIAFAICFIGMLVYGYRDEICKTIIYATLAIIDFIMIDNYRR